MSLKYDFKKLPSQNASDDTPRLYPIALKTRTIDTATLAEDIQEYCSISVADVCGTLSAISEMAAVYLSKGYHVELEGLGILSPGIACKRDENGHTPVITDPRQVKPRDLQIARINFDASPKLMTRLEADTTFERATPAADSPSTRTPLPTEERRAALDAHFAAHPTLTIRHYAALTGLSRQKAAAELHALVEEGILRTSGISSHLVFLKR